MGCCSMSSIISNSAANADADDEDLDFLDDLMLVVSLDSDSDSAAAADAADAVCLTPARISITRPLSAQHTVHTQRNKIINRPCLI